MSLPEKFYDSDGNKCSLDLLCIREPAWAANRIRSLTDRMGIKRLFQEVLPL